MRRTGLYSLILLIAATIAAGPDKKPDPLPELNAKVEAFAKAHVGKPVGDGICITLAIEALQDAGAQPGSFRDKKGDYTWGTPVEDWKDVLPGDILQFRDAVFDGKRSVGRTRTITWHYEYPHHTAVVAKVEQGGKLVTVYHQNVATKGEKESDKLKVRTDELRMDSLKSGGWVKAYRPAQP